MKFQGDIACLAHVLNLVVQDILKALIKEVYNDLDNNLVYNIENEDDDSLDNRAICNESYHKVTRLVGFWVEASAGLVVLSPRLGSRSF